MSDYFICPHCGAEVQMGAASCQACGSDEETGWSEFTYMDNLGAPDSDEYQEIKRQEFSGHKGVRKNWVIITAAFLLIGISIIFFRSIF